MLRNIYNALKAIMSGEKCQRLCCRACRALSRAFSRSRRQQGSADEANHSIPELVSCVECGAVRSEMQRLGARITRLETQHELVLAANAGTSTGTTSRLDEAVMRALAQAQLSSISSSSSSSDAQDAQTQTSSDTQDVTGKGTLPEDKEDVNDL